MEHSQLESLVSDRFQRITSENQTKPSQAKSSNSKLLTGFKLLQLTSVVFTSHAVVDLQLSETSPLIGMNGTPPPLSPTGIRTSLSPSS